MTPDIIYGTAGIALFGLGLFHALARSSALRRIIALNVCAVGASFVLIVAAWRAAPQAADPVPHALVITGIVVLVSASAVALALVRRLHDLDAETGSTPTDPQDMTA